MSSEVDGLVATRIVDTIGENRLWPSAQANPVISRTGANTLRRPGVMAPPKVGSKKYFCDKRQEKISRLVKKRLMRLYSTSFVSVTRSTLSTTIVFRNRSA